MPKASGTSRRFTRSPRYWPGDRRPRANQTDAPAMKNISGIRNSPKNVETATMPVFGGPFTTLPALTVKIVAVCMKTSIITASVRSQSMSWRR